MLSIIKKYMIGCCVAAVFMVLLELFLFVADLDFRPKQYTLSSKFHPDGGSVTAAEPFIRGMAQTVLDNAFGNVLTVPSTRYIWSVKRNPTGKPLNGYSGINSDGFRCREITNETKHEKNILILGASCAFGWDIHKAEDTFPHHLELILKENGLNYNVYNLGQPGYSTTQGLALYNDWIDKINPEIIIFYFGANDSLPTKMLTDKQTIQMLNLMSNTFIKKIKNTRIFGLVYKGLELMGWRPRENVPNLDPEMKYPRVPMNEAKSNMQIMSNGVRSFVIIPPYISEDAGKTNLQVFIKNIREVLENQAVFVDINSMKSTAPNLNNLYFKDGVHPTPQGHLNIAKEMATAIISGKL